MKGTYILLLLTNTWPILITMLPNPPNPRKNDGLLLGKIWDFRINLKFAFCHPRRLTSFETLIRLLLFPLLSLFVVYLCGLLWYGQLRCLPILESKLHYINWAFSYAHLTFNDAICICLKLAANAFEKDSVVNSWHIICFAV